MGEVHNCALQWTIPPDEDFFQQAREMKFLENHRRVCEDVSIASGKIHEYLPVSPHGAGIIPG